MEQTIITCDKCRKEIPHKQWTKIEIYYTNSATHHHVCDLCNSCRPLVLAELGRGDT